MNGKSAGSWEQKLLGRHKDSLKGVWQTGGQSLERQTVPGTKARTKEADAEAGKEPCGHRNMAHEEKPYRISEKDTK